MQRTAQLRQLCTAMLRVQGRGRVRTRGCWVQAAVSAVQKLTLRVSSNSYRSPGAPPQTVCGEHNWMEA